jgi:predicted small secreted protein
VFTIAPPYSQDQIAGKHHYFLSIEKRDYFPLWIEIDYLSKDTLDVFLELDPNFKEEKKGLFFSWGGTPMMKSYYPKPFRKWEDLPVELAQKIKESLVARIGEKAFEKLYISTAHQFDTDLMNRLGVKTNYPPGSKSYRICFSFSDPEKGIAQYTSEAVYLDNGLQIVAPKFPEYWMWESEEKQAWTLKSPAEIKSKLFEDFGDSFSTTQPRFEFYPRGNTFSWVFAKEIGKSPSGEEKRQEVYLDSITGEVLAVFYDRKMVISH